MLPQGIVLFFPDTEEILGVWRNLLMFIEAAVGGIGHRIEAGPKAGIQKRTGEGPTRSCGCSDRTRLHRKPEGRLVRFRDESWVLAGMASVGTLHPTEPPLLSKEKQSF